MPWIRNGRVAGTVLLAAVSVLSPSDVSAQGTSGATLSLSPATTTASVGGVFTLDVQFNTGSGTADTVDAYLDFNAVGLEVVGTAGNAATSIEANSGVFNQISLNAVDNAAGRINFSASKTSSPFLSGSNRAATIRFRAKAEVGTTNVTFVRSGARQSNLYLEGDPLTPTLSGATVTVSGPTAPPTSTSAPPAPTTGATVPPIVTTNPLATATPTAPAVPIATATRTATPTVPAGTPTAPRTLTATTTAAPTAPGTPPGRAFALTDVGGGGALLRWLGGEAASLTLLEVYRGGVLVSPLLPTETTARRSMAAGQSLACWLLVGVRVDGGTFSSDLHCLFRSPSLPIGAAPSGLTITLAQSNVATVSFQPGPGATEQLGVALGTPRAHRLGPTDSLFSDDTRGATTCYVVAGLGGVVALSGPGPLTGLSNVVCTAPGQSAGLAGGSQVP